MHFLVLQHLDIEPPALIAEVLRQAGHSLHTLHLDDGESLPEDVSAYAGIIIMGGPQSANDEHRPYIQTELHWLARRINESMPMLGICLGSQLMAKAAGANISASPQRELGWFPVFPCEATVGDPLFSNLPESGLTVFQWHGETFSLPDKASQLLTHPEVPAQ
ncbi:MAG: type 1 glutamine amidotransferase, partial [Mariprofundaceae bacterium]|nr:type 1 glutamine amidotransferase [Mariprofundaceae bacterium]